MASWCRQYRDSQDEVDVVDQDDGRGHCERGREVGVAEENGVIVVVIGEVAVVENVSVKVDAVIVNEVVRPSLRRRSLSSSRKCACGMGHNGRRGTRREECQHRVAAACDRVEEPQGHGSTKKHTRGHEHEHKGHARGARRAKSLPAATAPPPARAEQARGG